MPMQIAGRGNNLGGPVAKISGAVVPPPAVTYILDTLALATPVACSTRKLKAAYAGASMRVRRSSDNLEADIGFTAGGDLDTAALLAHTGVGDGFITTLYDQSGGVGNLSQATVGAQPRIVSAGVVDRMAGGTARPMIRTDGIAHTILSPVFAQAQPFTRSSVLQFLRVAAGDRVLGNPEDIVTVYFPTAGNFTMFGGASLLGKAGVVIGDAATVVEGYAGVGSVVSYNGVTNTGDAGATAIATGITVARDAAGGTYASALYGDVILFNSALSAGNRATLEANQKAWFGTP